MGINQRPRKSKVRFYLFHEFLRASDHESLRDPVTDINFFMTYPELLTDTNWVALIGMILVFGALYFILDLIIDKTLKRRMQK